MHAHPLTLNATLKRLAPGTALRDGLERILRGRTGALIVLGFNEQVATLCDGGFELDVEFTATRLRELCKMDGAVVLSDSGNRIRRANVQLMPDAALPTSESGTRHRSAERTALQTGYPVIAVSQSMKLITVYVNDQRHVLQDSAEILSRANQGLATMERYRQRLDRDNQYLFRAELNHYSAVADVVAVVQRMEMLRRAAATIHRDVIELGVDGKQLGIQLAELHGDNEHDLEVIVRDYLVSDGLPNDAAVQAALQSLQQLPDTDLVKGTFVARILGFPVAEESLNQWVVPRGYRVLNRVPRVQSFLMDKLAGHFGDLHRLLEANIDDIAKVDHVGTLWARHIHDGLSRLRR
ncbi:DNA integrity scanning diadenylate cyclase DisA [Corynebacterium sp.]|uniref:DNA integrity scanning diadenylate cyclase DisA n=1 Tax=Corynebacterium sp. TaxID=1720 RepID=UPI0026DAD907|nr:DNA integrity scanning diadenylate cyclase DisA [Corynebacterium sp.]MDO5076899.1 DNA integrity scanning diadenylate cyclase DisA [Corynebacterium sp.]